MAKQSEGMKKSQKRMSNAAIEVGEMTTAELVESLRYDIGPNRFPEEYGFAIVREAAMRLERANKALGH